MADQLTLKDPVDLEILNKLKTLVETRKTLSDSYLNLEMEKIRVLAAVREIDKQNARLFERCLVERGLPPGTEVDIDLDTGFIVVSEPPKEA